MMKGFKKDGKFRPTEKQSSGISSSQIRSKKSVISSTGKASEIREKKSNEMNHDFSLKKLEMKLTGRDGNEDNLIYMKTKTVEESGIVPDSWDLYDPEKKYIGLVHSDGNYSWVSFNDNYDWDVRGQTENIEEQYDEEQARYFLKYGMFKRGAGDV